MSTSASSTTAIVAFWSVPTRLAPSFAIPRGASQDIRAMECVALVSFCVKSDWTFHNRALLNTFSGVVQMSTSAE